jgi:predicted amidohydrolase YtcJ
VQSVISKVCSIWDKYKEFVALPRDDIKAVSSRIASIKALKDDTNERMTTQSVMKVFLMVLCALAFAACIGHEREFVQSLFLPRPPADWVLRNGKIVTVDQEFSIKEAVAIKSGRFVAVGENSDVRRWVGPATRVVNLGGRTVIPGLIDSHIHATVAALSWDVELHWEFTRSLADGLKQIASAAKERPPGSWIVVGGGWSPTQFPERRLPTRAELDAIAPKHRIYVQYLRQAAVLNSAALDAVGISRQTTDPVDGKLERDPNTGDPTGMLLGVPAWEYAYHKIPRLSLDRMRQSFRNCFRELNRLGLTSVGDMHTSSVTFAHRRLLADLAGTGQLTLRINYYVTPNEPEDELEQLRTAAEEVKQLPASDMFRFAGFAETLIRGTGDGDVLANPQGFTIESGATEKFRRLIRFLAENGYNFHLHTTQDNTARQLLDVIEAVNRELPLSRLRIAFAHLEDATAETITRIKKLGGGVSVQDRMALTGERNVDLWGQAKARNAPPLRLMIDSGVPLGAGTDAFRSGNYSPFLSLWWLVTGKTLAGTPIRDRAQNVTREQALRMYTIGSAWFTSDERRKGSIEVGKLADLAVLNADYLTVPEDQIRAIVSLLTMVDGRIVYADRPFNQLGSN